MVSSSSEFLRSLLPLGVFRPEHAYLRFSPSSRHHQGAATSRRRMPCLHFLVFRSQAFTTSQRFAPPLGFAGLFHPAATFRVRAVQGLLSPRSCPISSTGHAPLPFSSFVLTAPEGTVARLGRLDSEAFIHARPRSTRFGVTRARCRSPLRFSSPPGRLPPVASSDYSEPSAHGVTALGLQADPLLVAYSVFQPAG